MINPDYSYLDIVDELTYAIRDLRKMIFLSECYDLYRRDLIPNLRYNSIYYNDDLLDDLQSDLIGYMNQYAYTVEFLVDSILEHNGNRCKADDSATESAPPTP